jgi:hypothetical protein
VGNDINAVIHCEPKSAWQPIRAAYFQEGFRKAGIPCEITSSRERQDGMPVLLGTSFWRGIERDGAPFLLVDRCSFGDTTRFVSLVWNGHGRRGDHRLPDRIKADRWEAMGERLLPWKHGSRFIVCGQTETYSPHYREPANWYKALSAHGDDLKYRPHPAEMGQSTHKAPCGSLAYDFEGAIAVTLNSSIGVKCVIEGVPTITMDEGSMAWDVTGHALDGVITPAREEWAHVLAYTQWSDDEIKEGKLWDSLW